MIRYMKIGMLIKYVTQTHNRYVKMYVMEAYKTGIQYRYVRGMCCGMSYSIAGRYQTKVHNRHVHRQV